jgi:RNA polymerase sigma-70 factor (ECF subfamily)
VPSADFARELEPHRSYLLRVARLQLRDEAQAEDVVQDTLLAALSGSGFSGKSSLRTWLTGILKHKIVDAIRRKQREPTAASAFGGIESEMDVDDLDAMFTGRGSWQAKPADWGDPEAALNQRQFLDIMEGCLEKLPPNTARVFMMREVMARQRRDLNWRSPRITSGHPVSARWRCHASSRAGLPARARRPESARRRTAAPTMIRKALGHIISCKDASRLVSRREDAALSAWQSLVLRLHLSVCAACTRFERQVRFLRTAMQNYRE